jgi:Ni/Co efflux regulator RcnB
MLKTIFAALLAASVIAAPAMATSAKTGPAPTAKTTMKTTQASGTKSTRVSRHHRIHKHIGAYKVHQFSKVSVKHATSPKRS